MENEFNIKKLLGQYFSKWYVYVITTILFLIAGFIYLKYTPREYSVYASVLIRDENNKKLGAENIIESLELFSKSKKVQTEMAIIKSFSTVKRTIEQLPFLVTQFAEGQIKTTELYKNTPYKITLDSTHNQLFGTKFFIEQIDESTFNLRTECQSCQVGKIDYGPKKYHNSSILKPYKKIKFGDTIYEKDKFRFVIERNEDFKLQKNTNYYFVLNITDLQVRKYLDRMDVSQFKDDASIIYVKLNAQNIDKEMDFLNKLMDNYVKRDLEEKYKIVENTQEFINDQLEIIIKDLEATEDVLKNFREDKKIIDFQASSRIFYERLELLEQEKSENIIRLNYFRHLNDHLDKNKAIDEVVSPSLLGIRDESLVKLLTKLNSLISDRKALIIGVNDKNPKLLMLDEKIKNLKLNLKNNVENLIKNAEISMDEVDRKLDKVNKEIKYLPSTEKELVKIQRKFNLNNNIYTYLLTKQAETGIAKAGYTPDNVVLDYAQLHSLRPVNPKKHIVLASMVVLGCLLPFIFFFIMSFFNEKISSIEELENYCALSILGAISRMDKGINTISEKGMEKSLIADSFRSVRLNSKYVLNDEKSNLIAITSMVPGEGKTFISINFAISNALSGKKTIIVGGDLRRPTISNYLTNNTGIGMSDWLINKKSIAEIIQPTLIENLDVICSGSIPPNPTELLENGKFEEMVNELKKTYDYIIVDTPPIGLVPEFNVIAKFSDANFVVVRHNYSTKSDMKKMSKILNQDILNSSYVVYNDYTSKKLKNYKGYYY